MKQTFTTPGGKYSCLCADMLKQPHLLIAGATGSGKSVLINSLIAAALHRSPAQACFVLIDPKRVELCAYRNLPHTIRYASEPDEIVATLNECVNAMEERYRVMQRAGQKKSSYADIYIIVDEFADLMTTQKKVTLPALCRLAQLGRAANMHLILATQRPTRDIITGQIKVNIDARVALRCPTAQDSRNIINVSGAELLPRYGEGFYLTPDTMRPVLYKIPMTPDSELHRLVAHWMRQKKRRWKAGWMIKAC